MWYDGRAGRFAAVILFVSLIAGILGGNAAAAVLKPLNLGMLGNSVAGLGGGLAAGQVVLQAEAVSRLNQPGSTGAASVMAVLVGSIIGGAALTLVAGLLRQVLARH
jgi:hypothetical protein